MWLDLRVTDRRACAIRVVATSMKVALVPHQDYSETCRPSSSRTPSIENNSYTSRKKCDCKQASTTKTSMIPKKAPPKNTKKNARLYLIQSSVSASAGARVVRGNVSRTRRISCGRGNRGVPDPRFIRDVSTLKKVSDKCGNEDTGHEEAVHAIDVGERARAVDQC